MGNVMRKVFFGLLALMMAGSAVLYLLNPQSGKQKTTEAETTTITQQYEQSEFKDHQLVTPDFQIKITSARLIPAGAQGNTNGQKAVFALWYEVTNTSDRPMTALNVWKTSFAAQQEVDGKTVTLSLAEQPDQNFVTQQNEELKPGHKIANAVAYQVENNSGINLLAYHGNQEKPIGNHIYQIGK